MITIGEPKIVKKNRKARLCCSIEINNETKELWIEVDDRYAKYFQKNRSDAFLVAMLPIAMRRKKDIKCLAPVSDELLHNLTNELIPAITKYRSDLYKTRILADIQNKPVKSESGVGCDIANGISSFHILSKYLDTDYKSLKLNHLCLNLIRPEVKSLKQVQKFENLAKKLDLPLIKITSNYSQDFTTRYTTVPVFAEMFGVYALKKLWRTYFYGSSGLDFSGFSVTNAKKYDTTPFDILILNALSTSDIHIHLEGGSEDFLQKVSDISSFGPAMQSLNVCLKEEDNCGKCSKCMSTLLALDALNKLDNFESVFDVSYYKKHKKTYFAYLEKSITSGEKLNIPVYEELKIQGKLPESKPDVLVNDFEVPEIYTGSLILKDIYKDKIIVRKQQNSIESNVGFSKIMTAILALESNMTQMMVDVPPRLIPGISRCYLFDLINMLLITQNNPVADIIAEAVSGSVEDFVELMNSKAKYLGMKNTNYTLPSGIGNDNYTTAEDCVKLMEYAIKNRHFCEIFSKKLHIIKQGDIEYTVKTSNPMYDKDSEFYLPELFGAKFGIRGHFSNMAVIAENEKASYLLVLLGTEEKDNSAANRYKDAKNLLSSAILLS